MSQVTQEQWTKQELMEIAKRQKHIIWMILISLVAMFISLFISFATIVTGIIQIYFIYKLATAVRSSAAWVYIILAFIPLVGLIALLIINSKATKTLKANGIKVGLMGARMADFDKITVRQSVAEAVATPPLLSRQQIMRGTPHHKPEQYGTEANTISDVQLAGFHNLVGKLPDAGYFRHFFGVQGGPDVNGNLILLFDLLTVFLWLTLVYPVWIYPILHGVELAKRNKISPKWMWFGVHPLFGWVAYLIIRTKSNPAQASPQTELPDLIIRVKRKSSSQPELPNLTESRSSPSAWRGIKAAGIFIVEFVLLFLFLLPLTWIFPDVGQALYRFSQSESTAKNVIGGILFCMLGSIAWALAGGKKKGPPPLSRSVSPVTNEAKIGDTKKCPHCAETIKLEATVCRFCNHAFSEQYGTEANTILDVQLAGFWRRVVALLVDGLVLMPITYGFLFGAMAGFVGTTGGRLQPMESEVFKNIIGFFILVFWWLYFALLETSKTQGTLGKMLIGIRVTDLQGNKISFGKASGRFFAKFLSVGIIYIGFLMAGWTSRKQALHDMVSGCLVLKK